MSKINKPNKRSTTKGVQQQKQTKKTRPTQRSNMLSGEAKGVSSAYAKGVKNNRPNIQYQKDGRSCRVVHKEFISNVTGSVAFATPITKQLNPGLNETFPWLSAIANNFEQYRVNMMKFRYLTRTGTNIPGSVLLYPDYDAADAAPISEQIASNYEEISEDAPWKDITCVLRVAGMHPMGPKKFVRATALAANLDIKTYDVGTLFLSTVDGTAVSWGKLWVEYDVTFFEPQLNPSGPPIYLGGSVVGGGVLTAANPLGTVPVQDPQSANFTTNATSTITFQQGGTVVVAYALTGTVISLINITTGGGSVAVSTLQAVINAGALQAIYEQAFTVLSGSTLTFVATATTITASEVRIGGAPVGSQN